MMLQCGSTPGFLLRIAGFGRYFVPQLGAAALVLVALVPLASSPSAFTAGQKLNTPALAAKELQTHWHDLAGADARQAYQSMWRLAGDPGNAVAFLDQRLKNLPVPDTKTIHRLIQDLDSDQFLVRARASAELEKIGLPAKAALEEAFAAPRSPEAYHRLKMLLSKQAGFQLAPPDLQTWRAFETLEHIGTPAARKTLKRLAQGHPLLWQTAQARLSLERLQKPLPVVELAKDIKETMQLKGHTSRVYGLDYHPDGKLLASAAADGTARLWDADGKQLATLAHGTGVWCVAFTGDGKQLATGCSDYQIRLWDVAGQSKLFTLAGHDGLVYCLAASPNGKLLASGASDKTVRLWNAATGHELAKLEGHEATVWTVGFSPDGRTIVSTSTDQSVRLWEVVTGKERAAFIGHGTYVRAAGVMADGKLVVSCDHNNVMKGWDLRTGKALFSGDTGHTGGIRQLACGPGGNLFATAGVEGNVKLWDAAGKELATLAAHTDIARCVAFRPDGQFLATGGYDKQIKIWKLTAP